MEKEKVCPSQGQRQMEQDAKKQEWLLLESPRS